MEVAGQRGGADFSPYPACTPTTACGIMVPVPLQVACPDSGAFRMPNEVCGQVRNSSRGLGDAPQHIASVPVGQHPLIDEPEQVVIVS